MRTLKFGKAPAQHDERTLKFKKYVKIDLPKPPDAYNSLDRLQEKIKTNDVATLFPMDANDRYGCCVIAGAAHQITNFHGLVGRKEVMSETDVVKIYLELSGGEDNGLVMLSTLKYWRKTGMGDHKLETFTTLEEKDHDDVKRAISMFGGAYLGFNVQDAAISDLEHHRIWTPGPTDGGGHCVVAIAYTPMLIGVLTWGEFQWATWDWWDKMVDESYVLLPPEAKESDFAPGFDYATLQTDLTAITG